MVRAMSDAYRQWIAEYQCKPGYVNNFFAAVFFLNLEDNHKTDKEFPIPLCVLEEELAKEDHNLGLSSDRATVSIALQRFVMHLLRKCTKERVTTVNYESVLRKVLSFEGVMREELGSPLSNSTSFHCLPTVCKIYIIGLLRDLAKFPIIPLKSLTNDTLNNTFYALPDGRVFVYVKTEKNVASINGAYAKQYWYPLYKYTQQFAFNVLSSTDSEWACVEHFLQSFGQHSVVKEIRAFMQSSLKSRCALLGEQGVAREKFLPFLSSIVAAEETKPTRRKSVAKSPESLGRSLSKMSMSDWNARCQYYPKCDKGETCEFIHPDEMCSNFLSHRLCPGQSCLFLHGPCPVDGLCDDDECIYEHYDSLPVVMRKKSGTPAQKEERSEKKKVRCQYFPNCRHSSANCKFVHPTRKCRNPDCDRGRWCIFLHGNCPEDGNCENGECPYEHYQSLPVAQRQRERRSRDGRSIDRRRSRSRAVSERSRRESSPDYDDRSRSSRNLSNSGEYSEDEDVQIEKKLEQRCRFFPGCTNRACKYIHPAEKCKAFPNCPYGLACLFVHKTCPKDGVCVKLSCNHEHYVRRNIGQLWCMNGSLCKKRTCSFLHPKECKAPCAASGNCWMYHPPAAVAAAANSAAAAPNPATNEKPSTNRRSPSAPRNATRKNKNERR